MPFTTTPEEILSVLESQKFFDWYEPNGEGNFENYHTVAYEKGHPKHITKEMVLADIVKMFGLKKPVKKISVGRRTCSKCLPDKFQSDKINFIKPDTKVELK